MFTGIIEATGRVRHLNKNRGNLDITIESSISSELKIDQSVSHNGICLTVVEVVGDLHRVTAVEETLIKTNLGDLKIGDLVNLERCTKIGERLDGHIVQGHVDQTATCTGVEEKEGSWVYRFHYEQYTYPLVVEKGSVCVNGISLTTFDVTDDSFSVAIIPYTYQNTNIKHIGKGSKVNLEFDIIGKYVARMIELRKL